MRVLVYDAYAIDVPDGGSMVSLREFLRVRNNDSDVEFFFLTNQQNRDYYRQYIAELGVSELYVPFPDVLFQYGGALTRLRPRSFLLPWQLLELNLRLAAALRANHIDTILFNEQRAGQTIGLAGLLTRAKMVCYVRSDIDINTRLSKAVYAISDAIICVSSGVLALLDRRYHAKAVVINEAIEPIRKQANARPADDSAVINLVNIANVFRYKNQLTLLKAVNDVVKTNRNVKLYLIGDVKDNDCYAELQEYIDANDLAQNVEFTGFVPNVDPYLATCDIYVQPSFSEGLARVVLEAYRYGIPVIGSAIPGIRSIVRENENGLLFDPADAADLAAKLIFLIDDDSARRCYGENGRELLARDFNLATNALKIEALLKS